MKTNTNVNGPTFKQDYGWMEDEEVREVDLFPTGYYMKQTCDINTFCAEITTWFPANTKWNRFKAWLGIGEKPEIRTITMKNLVSPQLIFDKIPMEKFTYGQEKE